MQELRVLPRPSPILRVLRQAASSLGLDHPSELNRGRHSTEQTTRAVCDALCSQDWEYITGMAALVSTEQVLHGWREHPLRGGGEGISQNCAEYAKFLQRLLEVADVQSELVQVAAKPNELFVTKRLGMVHQDITGDFACIDPNVHGNVRTQAHGYNVERRCCFSGHVALQVGDRVYDPTLKAVYANGIEDAIDFYVFSNPLENGVWRSKIILPQRRLLERPEDHPTGFGMGYLLE